MRRSIHRRLLRDAISNLHVVLDELSESTDVIECKAEGVLEVEAEACDSAADLLGVDVPS